MIEMADFTVFMDGKRYTGLHMLSYMMYSRDAVIRQVKTDADKAHADEFSIQYKSGKPVGRWEKKGSRWYRW